MFVEVLLIVIFVALLREYIDILTHETTHSGLSYRGLRVKPLTLRCISQKRSKRYGEAVGAG